VIEIFQRSFLGRTVSRAWGLLPRAGECSAVWRTLGDERQREAAHVLRHGLSGRVLTDGSERDRPVRFASRAAAGDFRTRFLDEAEGWEALPAEDVEGQAA
jgi:hypothetical protein